MDDLAQAAIKRLMKTFTKLSEMICFVAQHTLTEKDLREFVDKFTEKDGEQDG